MAQSLMTKSQLTRSGLASWQANSFIKEYQSEQAESPKSDFNARYLKQGGNFSLTFVFILRVSFRHVIMSQPEIAQEAGAVSEIALTASFDLTCVCLRFNNAYLNIYSKAAVAQSAQET